APASSRPAAGNPSSRQNLLGVPGKAGYNGLHGVAGGRNRLLAAAATYPSRGRERSMATDLGQVRPAPAAKYDAFVDGQLKRARQRIRTLDLTTGLLGFVAGSLAFALGMALCDRWLE